jgi:hypothetical protein
MCVASTTNNIEQRVEPALLCRVSMQAGCKSGNQRRQRRIGLILG